MNTENQDKITLTPDGNAMTVYSAEQTKAWLLDALAHCNELAIDLSQVGEMDSAGMQLLLLAKREAGRQGKTLRLASHSPAIVEMLDFFNMAAYFGDPMVIPARQAAQA